MNVVVKRVSEADLKKVQADDEKSLQAKSGPSR